MGTITRSIANNIVTGGKLDGTDGLNGTIPASNIADASLTSITSLSPSLGGAITSVSVDPPAPAEGQIWYNSSSGTLKGYLLANVNVWSAGGNLNTKRQSAQNGAVGTQNASIEAGGLNPSASPTSVLNFELYNGTAWTNSPQSLPSARNSGCSFGSQTAAVLAGGDDGTGSYVNTTIIWNGSAWSPSGNMNTTRGSSIAGYGTQTAGLGAGGYNQSPSADSVATESFNGTSWTTVNSLNTARRGAAGAGIQTAALYFGGSADPDATESWNGTSWTTVANLNTGRGGLGGMGTQAAAVAFGGSPYTGATELWSGSAWTTNPNSMATARHGLSQGGTQTAGLAIGGRGTPGDAVTTTEEWTGTVLATRTLTVS
jgi:hypothetical protein